MFQTTYYNEPEGTGFVELLCQAAVHELSFDQISHRLLRHGGRKGIRVDFERNVRSVGPGPGMVHDVSPLCPLPGLCD